MQKHYDRLEVTVYSSLEEIKISFRKLAKKHHPDLNAGSDAVFKEINESYHWLLNNHVVKIKAKKEQIIWRRIHNNPATIDVDQALLKSDYVRVLLSWTANPDYDASFIIPKGTQLPIKVKLDTNPKIDLLVVHCSMWNSAPPVGTRPR